MELSEEKNSVLGLRGLVAVRAGPGSGKTLLLAKRLADALQNWPHRNRGVAVMSFTNTAHEEIQRQAHEEFGVANPVRYPHFLGTIDSFVNTYVFMPFGHLAMGCAKRPDLVGPPHGWFPSGLRWAWGRGYALCHREGCRLADFSYDVNGHLVNQRPRSRKKFDSCPLGHRACQELKGRFTEAGYATQSDANFYAMKLLAQRPQVAKALVSRFPLMLIDEAQDSSDVQMRIVEILVENGLSEVFMVGDPDQAIYEWRSARPELFRRKWEAWSPDTDPLRENWRSSQVICDFASLISSLPRSQIARRDGVKDMIYGPEVWSYERSELPQVIQRFHLFCEKRGLDLASSRVAIVARSSEIVRLIRTGREGPPKPRGQKLPPWPDALPEMRDVALGAFLFSQGRYAASMRRMIRAACSLEGKADTVNAAAIEDFVDRHGFAATRIAVFRLLKAFPDASGTLANWCSAANMAFGGFCNDFLQRTEPFELKVVAGREHRSYYNSLDFWDEFADELDDDARVDKYHVGTVHSVKGQTVDALLLVLRLKDPTGPYYPKMVHDRIADRTGDMCEALRILYVAFTRPRKFLVTAVPSSEIETWREVLPGYVPPAHDVAEAEQGPAQGHDAA